MPRKSRTNEAIRAFILDAVGDHPRDIARLTAQKFGVPRQTAGRYLRRLVSEGALTATGSTKARRYAIRDYISEHIRLRISAQSEEHVIWRERVAPLLRGELSENVFEICEYGVQEMVNNAIGHSESDACVIEVYLNIHRVMINIIDYGIGIFEKIRAACNFDDSRLSILELSKGKLTTDPDKHSGEGIFFTSRMFDRFCILSGHLFFAREMVDDDWLIESDEQAKIRRGTMVSLEISRKSTQTVKQVYKKYENDDYRFVKTHVPVRLARYDDEQLVSRSQARRVLARFERFSEIILDFKDVPHIGQAFADEIFRVFRNEHPNIIIHAARASLEVEEMIKHVTGSSVINDPPDSSDDRQPDLFSS